MESLPGLPGGIYEGILLRGEQAIEFCAGWGRLRIYVIRDRYASVDLLDRDERILEAAWHIINNMQRMVFKKAFISNEPPTQFILWDIREFVFKKHYGLGYGCVVLGLLDTEEEIDLFLEKVAAGKYFIQNLFV